MDAEPGDFGPYQSDLEFLGAALDLLRLKARLRIAERERLGLAVRDPVLALSETTIDREAVQAELDDKSARHSAALAAAGALGFQPQLLVLQERFGLDGFERDVMLLCLAPAIDGSFNGLFGRAKGSAYRAAL